MYRSLMRNIKPGDVYELKVWEYRYMSLGNVEHEPYRRPTNEELEERFALTKDDLIEGYNDYEVSNGPSFYAAIYKNGEFYAAPWDIIRSYSNETPENTMYYTNGDEEANRYKFFDDYGYWLSTYEPTPQGPLRCSAFILKLVEDKLINVKDYNVGYFDCDGCA